MESSRRVIEINGVKVDVDLREASAVETLRVGDAVRVLTKDYASNYKVSSGCVIGFEQFKNLPTIVIAYADVSYSDADVKFLHYNNASKDVEVIAADEATKIGFDMQAAKDALAKKIEKAEQALKEARQKRDYFIVNIGRAWAPAETV